MNASKTMGAIGFVILVFLGIFLDKSKLTNTDYLLIGITLILHCIGTAVGELIDFKRAEKNQ
jgi:hypothetical protein